MGTSGWCRLPSLLIVMVIAVLSSTVPSSHADAHARPLDAIHSLVILESTQPTSSSSPAAACAAVQVAHDRLLTSHSCDVASLTTARFIHDVSDDEGTGRFTTSVQTTKDVVWTDSKSMQVLNFTRGDGGDGGGGGGGDGGNATKPLALPPAAVTYPTQLSVDRDASILELDLDSLELTIIHDVVFVDKSLCIPESEEEDEASATLDGDEASICVAPANVDDRVVKGSPPQARRVWRFLVKREGAKGKGNHVLLGLGIRDDDGKYDHNAFHLSSWLGTTLLDEAFASSVGVTPHTPVSFSFSRVVGGQKVNQLDLNTQFIAGIRELPFDANFCTGSLIAPRFVLTAGHCLGEMTPAWVMIGSPKSSGVDIDFIPVKKMIRHPKYNAETLSNDFLILVLARYIVRKPIRLLASAPKGITKATAFGYGVINRDGTVQSDVLRSVELPLVVDKAKCEKAMGTTIDDSMICAGGQAGQNTCLGDSGGPLIVNAGTKDQRLLGVVSFGSGDTCADAGVYSGNGYVPAAISFLGRYARRPKNPVPRPPDEFTIRPGGPLPHFP